MKSENSFLDPALEQAMSEIRQDAVDPAVIEAAAARVWAKIAAAPADAPADADSTHHIRTCADFQALLPDYRASLLPEARAFLLKDHLNECVACRRVFEGRVFTMPAQSARRRGNPAVRWAAAAAVFAAAGLSVWVAVDRFGTHTGHAVVHSVDGTLYAVSADGIRALAAGQALPNGVEFRTAKNSDAMLELHDGSVVELRERSGFTASETPTDLTIHLIRGAVIVQAAKRRAGHLYVSTADARVAVTGTIFGVSAGVKGSRVSVIQGEVHVEQDNRDQVLHPGDQTVTSPEIEPESVRDDIGWSRNRDQYYALLSQLAALRSGLRQLPLPGLRYSSNLLPRLPANTVFYASIPNLAQYLGGAEKLFHEKMALSPELNQYFAGGGFKIEPLLEKARAGSEYLGDEIALAGIAAPDGHMPGLVCFAQVKREGFADFLNREISSALRLVPGRSFPIESRNGFVVFGPSQDAVESLSTALDTPAGGFEKTPFYSRIEASYRHGAGLLLTADLGHLGAPKPVENAQYLIAEEKQVDSQMESRASFYFDPSAPGNATFAGRAAPVISAESARRAAAATSAATGIAAWLASPAPMGALDYISPEATVVTAFAIKDPNVILNQAAALLLRSSSDFDGVRTALTGSLGGEFALALDGPAFPVPSWKLIVEVYDPARIQAGLQQLVAAYNGTLAADTKPLRTSQETVAGRTYYMIAGGEPNALTEAHYTFADGFLIAAPTRTLVERALQVKMTGASIMRSSKFLSMIPRDHHTNVSAVVYQNLGTTLAPLAGLAALFMQGHGSQTDGAGRARQNQLPNLANLGSNLLAVYAEPDHLTVATDGDILGGSLTNLLSGDVLGIAGGFLPLRQVFGTTSRQPAYR